MPVFAANNAQAVGPTIDVNAEHAAPKWREEAHDMPILRSAVALKGGTPRPMTHKVSHDMQGPVLNSLIVRNSNVNPDAAGEGSESSTWRQSHGTLPGMGEEIEAPRAITPMTIALGLGLGLLLWKMRR